MYPHVFTIQGGLTVFLFCSTPDIPCDDQSELGVRRVSGTVVRVGEIYREHPFVQQWHVAIAGSAILNRISPADLGCNSIDIKDFGWVWGQLRKQLQY